MDSNFCQRLLREIRKAKNSPITHLVIEGGYPFSNGINLNTIEKNEFPEQEAWRNINLIDDVVQEILSMENLVTIAAMKGNAGAGGVALAAACDYVVASEGAVLNPHYKNMGLYGSEYWTHSLPKRMGTEMALKVTNECLPLLAEESKDLNLVDFVVERDLMDAFISERIATSDNLEKQLEKKWKLKSFDSKPLEEHREEELSMMKKCFFDNCWGFREQRKNFVYKKKDQALNPLLYPQWKNQEKKDLRAQYKHKVINGN